MRKIINQSDWPELGDVVRTFNFRIKRDDSIVQARNIDCPKAENLDNVTHERAQRWPETAENGIEKPQGPEAELAFAKLRTASISSTESV